MTCDLRPYADPPDRDHDAYDTLSNEKVLVMMRYGSYGDGGIGWGGWFAMAAMMVAFWGAIAWVIVTQIRHGSSRSAPQRVGGTDALALLDERFARGEIDEDEFQRRRLVLRGDT